MKGYRLKSWVIPAGLTIVPTSLFAVVITQRAAAYRGYLAIGGEWVLIIVYALFVYRLIAWHLRETVSEIRRKKHGRKV